MADTVEKSLRGGFAKVWLDGNEIGLAETIEAKIAIDYTDFYVGFDKDRRETSQSGSGSLTFMPNTSIITSLYKKFKDTKGLRFTIEANLADPASNGQEEGYQLNGVSFDEFPLANWTKGEVIKKELSFAFPPSQMIILDEIVE